MPGQSLLVEMLDIEPHLESEFNSWYDEDLVPRMLSLPGVLGARRYRAIEGEPRYLALFDLADEGVVGQPEYLRLRPFDPGATPSARALVSGYRGLMRGVYRLLLAIPTPEPEDLSAARTLGANGMEIDPEHDEELQEWYNTDHMPALASVRGVLRARRYRLWREASELAGNPPQFLAFYDMVGPEVRTSEEWLRKGSSPWTKWIQRFRRRRLRNTYERILPA